ncbi:MAG: hypothetical protein K2W95_26800 [Candidatus Obscuribacterales bacterium]|nr:hypothetical protein [Candidatus Obscuribacterales bacterium]
MRDRKDPGLTPLEDTPCTKEFMDSNRARILYAKNELKPLQVRYSDGATAQFKYAEDNTLTELTERNGTYWTRTSPASANGFSQWRSSDGQLCILKFSVLPDGTYQRQDPSGVIETVTTGNKRFIAISFPPGFDAVHLLRSSFQNVDRNRDTTLTRMELDAALATHGANRSQLTLFAMLRHYFDEIIRTRDDPMLIEAGGLTIADLERFQQVKAMEQLKLGEVPAFLHEFFDSLFATIDKDHDGMTNLDEIGQVCGTALSPPVDQLIAAQAPAMSNECFHAQMAEFGLETTPRTNESTTETIKSIEGDHAQKSLPLTFEVSAIVGRFLRKTNPEALNKIGIHDGSDWIYKKTFMQLCEMACAEHTKQRVIRGGWCYDEQKSIATIPRNIFTDADNPAESVRVEAVVQGTLGDPVLLATLIGFVNANPPAVLRALRQEPGKSCTVTFPGAPQHPITMSWLTSLEISLFQNSTTYGIWCAFVQKAYEVYLALNDLSRSPVPEASDSILHTTNLPFELLTGKKCGWRPFTHTHLQEVESLIEQNLQRRLPVLVSTGPLESWIDGARLVPSNVLALIRLNKETGEVVLRDPLASISRITPGTQSASSGSTLTVRLEQLCKHFLAISITL